MSDIHDTVQAGGMLVQITHGHKNQTIGAQLMLTPMQVRDRPRAQIMREIERQLDFIDRRKADIDQTSD
jgi:hypothetical protein